MAGPVIATGFRRRSEGGRLRDIVVLLRISTRHWQSSDRKLKLQSKTFFVAVK